MLIFLSLSLYRYFHDFLKRIPRVEMVQLRDIALGHIATEDERFVADVCGSFRRGQCESIDWDHSIMNC